MYDFDISSGRLGTILGKLDIHDPYGFHSCSKLGEREWGSVVSEKKCIETCVWHKWQYGHEFHYNFANQLQFSIHFIISDYLKLNEMPPNWKIFEPCSTQELLKNLCLEGENNTAFVIWWSWLYANVTKYLFYFL